MNITPLKLTLYDPETNEIIKEFTRAFIPTGIFTELVKVTKGVDLKHPENIELATLEQLYALISELFGNQLSIDQIKKGTDLGEFLTLFETVVSRVGASLDDGQPVNPTLPGTTSRRRHSTKI